ncbi:hypothetical protein ACQCN2_05155 [Brevibacillus ginsengisoli]|uniref:hypothetical protein n=1 Tax=Brevibacillus ginsengisoli TaxID=363854 RepID=UPI003CEDE336
MNKNSVLANIKLLVQMHSDGQLGGEVMPEDVLIGIVPDQELPNVLTLGMSLNYQRNSYSLWKAIVEAYQDPNARWIFRPRAVAETNLDELRNVLISYRVALQPNRHPEIWQRVSKGILQSSPSGDVMGLFESVQYDIAALKSIIQTERKSDFPYLAGPKIFNYWLYVMETYIGIRWKSRELITIAPDTHILKATVKLGICSEEVLNGTEKDRQVVSNAWENVLKGSGLAPIDVHTPLWLWSRAGFPSLTK